MKHYTIGQIVREGLLLNHKGEPYRHKATVLRIVKGLKHKRTLTPYGWGYAVSESDVRRHNSRRGVR
jgi:hypothetical protein